MVKRRDFIKLSGSGIAATALSSSTFAFPWYDSTKDDYLYEVIIIGGSYAGLSAALALGRSLRKVLIIDGGKPCNAHAPFAHNLISQDGSKPSEILEASKKDVEYYETVNYLRDTVFKISNRGRFKVKTKNGDTFFAKKIILASGLKDLLPNVPGFKECWGKSILHCPYCHGYEVKNIKTAVVGNGNYGYEFSKLIRQWTDDLVLITGGKSTLTSDQTKKIKGKGIHILETEPSTYIHKEGFLTAIKLKDGHDIPIKAVYTRPSQDQNTSIPRDLGCEFLDNGLIKTDDWRRTNIKGFFACGDNSAFRTISTAIYTGSMAGIAVNHELINEHFGDH